MVRKQMLTFRVVIQGETNPLLGAMETAVNLINLNRGLGLLLRPLAILPDVLIWHNKSMYKQTKHKLISMQKVD